MKKHLIALLLMLIAVPMLSAHAETKYATVFNPDTGDRKAVEIGDPSAFDGGYLLEVVSPQSNDEGLLGFSVITDYGPRLATSITSVQTTLPVTSMSTKDGHTLVIADFGTKIFLTIEAGASKEEIVVCTGISGTTFTGCTRGLAFYGNSLSTVAANQYSHQSGSSILLSNSHYVYNQYVSLEDAQTITGIKTYSVSPIVPNPTTALQAATKTYVDSIAQQGGATSTEAVVGISQLATQAEMAAGTFTTDEPQVISTQYATSSSDVAQTSVPITDTDGKLDQSFLDLTEDFTLTGSTTFNGLNYFNGYTELEDVLIASSSVDYSTASSSIASVGYVVDNFSTNKLLYSTIATSTVSDASEGTIFSYTIPGGTLTSSGVLVADIYGTFQSSGGYSNVIRLKFGGTTICSVTLSTGSELSKKININLYPNGSTSLQKANISLFQVGGTIKDLTCSGFSAIDTTSDSIFSITAQASNAGNADTVVEDGYINLLN